MRRQTNRLTVKAINAALRRAPAEGKVMLNDGNGLYIQIKNQVPSWLYRYVLNGRTGMMGLGPLDPKKIDLAAARERADEARKLKRRGIDPLAHKRRERQTQLINAAKAVPSFAECAHRYIEAHRAEWKNGKQAHEWSRSLALDVFPTIGRLPVNVIDTGLVLRCLKPIWEDKLVTASRERQRIENILDWAKAEGYRDGENPARWKGHLEHSLAKPSKLHTRQSHPALPHRKIAAFMTQLRQVDGIPAAALEFLILCGSRSDEVLGAPWKEFDLTERLWTIPGHRMKGGKEHQVPLSPPAMAIIERMATLHDGVDGSAPVFPGIQAGKPLGHQAMRRVLKALQTGDDKVDVHGFRSTFRDWAAEETDFDDKIAEMAIAHTVGTQTKRAYERTALLRKRRQLVEEWAMYCSGQREPQSDHRIAA